MNKFIHILSPLITLTFVLFLLITAILAMFNPFFIQLEYNAPGFPPDDYGFTTPQRLQYARISLEYLLNDQPIRFLGQQTLPDGSPLYNERELSHMLDVKILVQAVIRVWLGLTLFLIATAVWAWRTGWLNPWLSSISLGGWITVALIITVLIAVAVSFNALFTGFHKIFFTGDTWLFLYTDSLIRLFPMRLWQDAFIGAGLLGLIGGVLTGILGLKAVKFRNK
jgi:integral membrane protein (TIGR01906 family)